MVSTMIQAGSGLTNFLIKLGTRLTGLKFEMEFTKIGFLLECFKDQIDD